MDDKLGVISVATPWGHWHQTIDEVVVFVTLPPGTRGRDLVVDIKVHRGHTDVMISVDPAPQANTIECRLRAAPAPLFAGRLAAPVVADDCLWTIEDGTLLRIVLQKQDRRAGAAWKALLSDGQFAADPLLFDSVEKKMTLERFQREVHHNPGFDFSNADLTGNYKNGGPQLPEK